MKDKQVFFNPFRIISPRLDREASRLKELYKSPPADITCLEEGLLVMLSKLIEMADLTHKSLILTDSTKLKRFKALGDDIHQEEKELTGSLLCEPHSKGALLKALVLFPGHLERVGDYLESIMNCAQIKERDGVPFSDKAQGELAELFHLIDDILKNCRDIIATDNRALLEPVISQQKRLHQMTLDFALAHEDRLLEGMCSPKASSLYLDILDSIKGANEHLQRIVGALANIDRSQDA